MLPARRANIDWTAIMISSFRSRRTKGASAGDNAGYPGFRVAGQNLGRRIGKTQDQLNNSLCCGFVQPQLGY
jgi:hypothetical protein